MANRLNRVKATETASLGRQTLNSSEHDENKKPSMAILIPSGSFTSLENGIVYSVLRASMIQVGDTGCTSDRGGVYVTYVGYCTAFGVVTLVYHFGRPMRVSGPAFERCGKAETGWCTRKYERLPIDLPNLATPALAG